MTPKGVWQDAINRACVDEIAATIGAFCFGLCVIHGHYALIGSFPWALFREAAQGRWVGGYNANGIDAPAREVVREALCDGRS